MKNKVNSLLLILIISLFCFPALLNAAESLDQAEEPVVKDESFIKSEDKVGPNPQRIYCVNYWNKYYEKMKKANIKVSSKGDEDEIVVFSCPNCSIEKHYVDPFLNTEVDGKTGMDRIKECGFTKAVFKGSKGLREIERAVN